jgi:putative membrane protein
MRSIVSRIATNALAIFIASLLFSGITVTGGLVNHLIAGALLSFFSIFLDPIVKAITFPLHILTLGLLSFLTTLASLFVVTLVFDPVSVTAFVFDGFSFAGLTIGRIEASRLLSFVVVSATIYFVNKAINWVFK